MVGDFDLFGDPIPEGFKGRGRPPHVVTEQKRKLVSTLAAFDKSDDQIAAALGVTGPTLRKYYFRELQMRVGGRVRLEGMALVSLADQVSAGNVSAIALLMKKIERHEIALLSDKVSGVKKIEKLGKKEQRRAAADAIVGKFEPPAPPRLIN